MYRDDPRCKNNIKLYQCQSVDVRDLAEELHPDIVVINSVVQYFPSEQYRHNTILAATKVLRQGPIGQGAIFIGDVRNNATLYNFHLATKKSALMICPTIELSYFKSTEPESV